MQANGEALADFVLSIRKAAQILRLRLPETDIIQVILEGVTSQERSRLVFADRPHCFADLDRLCVFARTVLSKDESRERAARDDQDSRSSLERAKNDKHGGWWETQETGRKLVYFRSSESYKVWQVKRR